MSNDSSAIDLTPIKASELAHDSDPLMLSIEQLLRLILFESTEYLRKQKINDLKGVSSSQSEVSFLNNLRRIFMLTANEDDSFTVNDELKELLKKVTQPGNEGLMQVLNEIGLTFNAAYTKESFDALFAGIESMMPDPKDVEKLKKKLAAIGIEKDKEPTEDQLKELVKLVSEPEHLNLRKLLMDHGILKTKDSFTKQEKDNFIESIRLFTEQKNTLNEMTIQTISQQQAQIDQRQQYVIMAAKIYNDILKNIGQKTGR